ncbi:hypothetical protein AMTR_s00051p00029460 [Amborella trichopoda]|uniref:Uncharacterized protein n=1 Tax=Amborella trichopoda TaxID=13333 RepID=U5CTM1_AMBTC|nr:hypothetical protein AMTR_s00051p00029460 [Amborella trichopoda]
MEEVGSRQRMDGKIAEGSQRGRAAEWLSRGVWLKWRWKRIEKVEVTGEERGTRLAEVKRRKMGEQLNGKVIVMWLVSGSNRKFESGGWLQLLRRQEDSRMGWRESSDGLQVAEKKVEELLVVEQQWRKRREEGVGLLMTIAKGEAAQMERGWQRQRWVPAEWAATR